MKIIDKKIIECTEQVCQNCRNCYVGFFCKERLYCYAGEKAKSVDKSGSCKKWEGKT